MSYTTTIFQRYYFCTKMKSYLFPFALLQCFFLFLFWSFCSSCSVFILVKMSFLKNKTSKTHELLFKKYAKTKPTHMLCWTIWHFHSPPKISPSSFLQSNIKQKAIQESTAQKLSFEWSHFGIQRPKVRNTLHSIINSTTTSCCSLAFI